MSHAASQPISGFRRWAGAITNALMSNRVFRSIFRHGFADSNRNRSLSVFSNIFLHIHPVKVSVRAIQFTRTFYLGGLAAATFIILVVTGIFLMFYYHPSVPRAYEDMKDLQFVVYMGLFLRNLHRWGAHAMVALVLLHMVRVFFAGAYRPPREFNWVIGVMLLLLTILLSYTGYLLPWDQLAYWGVTVGTNMADSVPYFGQHIKFLLLGGREVNENALLRFYVLHCVLLPFFLVLLLSVHIWRVRKDGGIYLGEAGDTSAEPDLGLPPRREEEAEVTAARSASD
jgi:quinol-cytochrome oxidoreductase complex cytochrome b subunit